MPIHVGADIERMDGSASPGPSFVSTPFGKERKEDERKENDSPPQHNPDIISEIDHLGPALYNDQPTSQPSPPAPLPMRLTLTRRASEALNCSIVPSLALRVSIVSSLALRVSIVSSLALRVSIVSSLALRVSIVPSLALRVSIVPSLALWRFGLVWIGPISTVSGITNPTMEPDLKSCIESRAGEPDLLRPLPDRQFRHGMLEFPPRLADYELHVLRRIADDEMRTQQIAEGIQGHVGLAGLAETT
jgi:hypothetical protein